MTKLTVPVPSVGEKNTAAAPKVDTSLKAIEQWANGEVGTGNIEAGTVTEAMLVTAVQEKLGGTIFGLTHKASAISAAIANGELLELTGAGTTGTLPAATKNRVCGIYAAAAGVKLKTTAGVITGDFITGQATIGLELGQHVVVEAEGTNWRIIAGEPKEGRAVRTTAAGEPAIASWGFISQTGSIEAGSGDYTVSKPSTGHYKITWKTAKGSSNYAVVATAAGITLLLPVVTTLNTLECVITWAEANGTFASPLDFSFMVMAAS